MISLSYFHSVGTANLNLVVKLHPSSPTSHPSQSLYEDVKKEEFKVPDGEGGLAETFFNPEREGWLTKEGGKYKSKHRRWFILKEGMLYYFKQPSVSVPYHTSFSFQIIVIYLFVKHLTYSKTMA